MLGEFEIIQRYFRRDTNKTQSIVHGVGDDCAIVKIPKDKQLVMSIDTLVSGVHFLDDAEPKLIGARALSIALSDLAAMGAEPLCFTLALTLPQADEYWLKNFSEGLWDIAEAYDCPLVGGDTTRGPLTISIQVHGLITTGKQLLRSGACVGDAIYVTGYLGDGAAALATIKNTLSVSDSSAKYFHSHYYSPSARIAEGRELIGIANAAIDISDGLLADLQHICTASHVGAQIDINALPLSPAMKDDVPEAFWHNWAATGGDDYQLCFTVPPNLEKQLGNLKHVTKIGKVISEGQRVVCKKDGQVIEMKDLGYQHF